MCMKNVNAMFLLTTGVETLENGIRSVGAIFNGIVPKADENIYYLPDFSVVLNCSIIYNLNNVTKEIIPGDYDFVLDKKYEFMIRLTHIESGVGIALDTFDLELTQKDLKTWCKAFYEFKRFVKVPHLVVPKGLGNYAVKLLIREKTEEKDAPWVTQTLSSLVVGERYQ